MKNLVLYLSGLSALAAFVIARQQQQTAKRQPLEELAHRLEAAWADHHTVA